MTVAVSIVSFAAEAMLRRALDSLCRQTLPVAEVVVVDNRGSLPAQQLEKEYAAIGLRVVSMPFNLGCPAARTMGVAACRSEWVYCLDDDGWLDENAIASALGCVEEGGGRAIIQSQVLFPDGRPMFAFRGGDLRGFAAGACLLHRATFLAVGGYPLHFFRQGEEQHLLLRLWARGLRVAAVEASVMYHDKPQSEERNPLERVFGFAHALRTVLELFPLWLIPLGVTGKLLSWGRYLFSRGELREFMHGLLLALTVRPMYVQKMTRVPTAAVIRLLRTRGGDSES